MNHSDSILGTIRWHSQTQLTREIPVLSTSHSPQVSKATFKSTLPWFETLALVGTKEYESALPPLQKSLKDVVHNSPDGDMKTLQINFLSKQVNFGEDRIPEVSPTQYFLPFQTPPPSIFPFLLELVFFLNLDCGLLFGDE